MDVCSPWKSNSPLTGYKIEVFDEDIAFDDLLGWCYSDPRGRFALRFEESAFKDSAIEGQPELELRSRIWMAPSWAGLVSYVKRTRTLAISSFLRQAE